jgi:hypothetical protein
MAYEYPTNFSNGTVVDGIGSFVQYADYITEGWLALGFLLIIFMMTMAVGSMMSVRKTLAASSFITFIFSIYFMRLGMVNPIVVFGLLVLVIVGVLGSKGEGMI